MYHMLDILSVATLLFSVFLRELCQKILQLVHPIRQLMRLQ